ncbi:DUF3352 domain-containing protein [Nodosilinea sp. LEGE 07298]|uniref:DUF3352 domain-containing protein n=1 Tax=Nodosilinea sp. LEGE 07298 TaxID=2777970 RepID=UPI00187FDBBF|nr:DUF3352 domain-containing protein [Nodosilinea sp. LEGE 07298]MBE9112310.1 DUF3352 domain-containing protein [Nodosilinea sp. LEGE 07298]
MPPLTVRAVAAEVWQHLPENTAMVMLIDTTAATWGQLSQFQLFKLLETEQGLIPSLPGLPYLPYGIDFERDVTPWVGDTAVVALLPARSETAVAIADYSVMVAPIADAEAFTAFQTTFFELQEVDPEITSAQGADIYYWPAPEPEALPEEWLEWPESVPDPACGSAEVEIEPCADEMPVVPDASNGGKASSHGEERLYRHAAAPQIWRFGGDRVSLPLTVSPFHDEDTELEVEVPVPLPTFGPSGLAVAFLPDVVVTAESPAAVEQYLRLRQAGDAATLATSREFQRTLANRQRSRALFAVYGNALELLNYDLAPADLPNLGLPLPPTPALDADTLQTLRSLNFGGTLEALVYPLETGMQLRGRYYYDAVPFTFGLTPSVANADSPLTRLPASTFLLISGRDVAGFWRGFSRILENASDFTQQGLATARSFFTLATGLDLDQDVFGWMDGEVAIAAFPTEGGPLQYLGLGLLLQTSDRPTAESALAAVDGLLPSFGLSVSPRTINQQPATSWELGHNGEYVPELSVGSYGWVADDTLAITSGTVPMTSVLAPSPHDPLADFFLFDQATAAFPNPNNGYFYLNVGATLALAYQVFDLHNAPAFDSTKPYLGSLRSLSATTAQTPNFIEFQGQLGLAPSRD